MTGTREPAPNPPYYETVSMRLCVDHGFTRYQWCPKCGAYAKHPAKLHRPTRGDVAELTRNQ
jgi:hypothetical protein